MPCLRRQPFKNAHLYIPRSDLLQIVYTYTSPDFCRHPFQIVYTYMYPDAARTLPAALTLWAATLRICGQYRCTFFLPFLFRILPPLRVLLYVYILWAAVSVKVYTFHILRVTICIHFLYLFLYPDAAPALLAAIVFWAATCSSISS